MSKNANSKNRTQNTYNSTNETDRTTSKNAYDSKNTYDKTTSKNYAGKSSYDKAVIPSIQELGIEEKDARDYAIVGCVELTTQGNNLGWSDSAMFNLNKALEVALTGGICLLTGEKIAPDYGNLQNILLHESFSYIRSR